MRTIVCLTAILFGGLAASHSLPSESPATESTSPPPSVCRPTDRETDEAVRQWALGCAAVLTERNHDSHTLLAGGPVTEQSRQLSRKLLADAWDIHNRQELLETLTWLREEGHRSDFEELGNTVSGLSKGFYEFFLRNCQEEPEAINRLQIARQHYLQLGDKSLYGWDYGRAICLCRWAYTVGYLSEEEAWGQILPLARQLQAIFDSWEDLGANYLIGRRFWSHEQTQEDGWRYDDAVQRLLDMRDSPWNRHPWDLDLSGVPDTSDDALVRSGVVATLL